MIPWFQIHEDEPSQLTSVCNASCVTRTIIDVITDIKNAESMVSVLKEQSN